MIHNIKKFLFIILLISILLFFIWMALLSNHQENHQFKRFIYADEEGYLISPKKNILTKEESY